MNKKTKKIFNTIVFSLFILFISLFFASNTGYYEYQNNKKKTITEEKMKEFEEDLKNGKKIVISNYLNSDYKNYDNKVTKFGNLLSEIIDNEMMNILEKTFKYIEKSIE